MADELKRYTEPVRFKVGELDSVYWNPDAPETVRLTGNREIVNIITSFIETLSEGRDTIKVTPEGPYLPATVNNLYTVFWAVTTIFDRVGETVKFYGDVPSLKDLDLDYASNFDENGKPIIR
jgi:hypothetical protein